MKRIQLFVCAMFLSVIGCQTAEKQPTSAQEPEVVAAVKDSHSLEKRRLDHVSALKSEIVVAVKYALSLEERLFDHGLAFKSKKQVYEHYRQGFGTEIAKRLTEYSWAGSGHGLRPGTRTMEPPKKVEVSQIDDDEAIVFYKTPKWIREMWGTEKFTVVKLKKEEGRWVIVEAKGTNFSPSH